MSRMISRKPEPMRRWARRMKSGAGFDGSLRSRNRQTESSTPDRVLAISQFAPGARRNCARRPTRGHRPPVRIHRLRAGHRTRRCIVCRTAFSGVRSGASSPPIRSVVSDRDGVAVIERDGNRQDRRTVDLDAGLRRLLQLRFGHRIGSIVASRFSVASAARTVTGPARSPEQRRRAKVADQSLRSASAASAFERK